MKANNNNSCYLVGLCFSLLFLSTIFGCKSGKTGDVYDVLDSMRTMTVEERGVSFAHHVTQYIDKGDQNSTQILQDSTMAWIHTLTPSQQKTLADVIENEYRVIKESHPMDALH